MWGQCVLDRSIDWPGAKNEEVARRTPNYFMARSNHPGFDPSLSFFTRLPPAGR